MAPASAKSAQREEEARTMLRLAQGVQEDMMVALLEAVQGAAAACAEVCLQRLQGLHKEMLCAFEEAEHQLKNGTCNSGALTQSELVKRSAHLSTLGQKIFPMGESDSDGDDDDRSRAGDGHSIEEVYLNGDWESLGSPAGMTPPPVTPVKRRPKRRTEVGFKVAIERQEWTPVVIRKLLIRLRSLQAKHSDLVMAAPVMGKGEIYLKGSLSSIEAAKPGLARIVMDLFPWAGLPESLQVAGIRQTERLDAADGKQYTLKALWERCENRYSRDEVWAYWESEMKCVDPAVGEEAPCDVIEASKVGANDDQATQQGDLGLEESPVVRLSDPSRRQSRVRGEATPAARLLTRGLRAALDNAAPPEVGELKINLDKEHWPPALVSQLLPALQTLSRRFADLRVAPVMGKCQIFAKGELRSLEAAKPLLAAALLERCPFAELPACLQVEGVREPIKRDPADGRTYTLRALRDKYAYKYSQEEIWAYWEAEMWDPKASPSEQPLPSA